MFYWIKMDQVKNTKNLKYFQISLWKSWFNLSFTKVKRGCTTTWPLSPKVAKWHRNFTSACALYILPIFSKPNGVSKFGRFGQWENNVYLKRNGQFRHKLCIFALHKGNKRWIGQCHMKKSYILDLNMKCCRRNLPQSVKV